MKNLVFSLVLTSACCAHGQGILQIDQRADRSTPPGVYLNVLPGPTGQSFVPTFPSVGFVQLFMSDANTATIHVDLWADALATGVLLGSTDPVFVPSYNGITTFLFTTPVSVMPGTTYYFQPVIESGGPSQIGELDGFTYPNGSAFLLGVEQSTSDLWFREGIVVPEPSMSVLLFVAIASFWFRRSFNR